MKTPAKRANRSRPPVPEVPEVISKSLPLAEPPPEPDDEAIRRMLEAAYT